MCHRIKGYFQVFSEENLACVWYNNHSEPHSSLEGDDNAPEAVCQLLLKDKRGCKHLVVYVKTVLRNQHVTKYQHCTSPVLQQHTISGPLTWLAWWMSSSEILQQHNVVHAFFFLVLFVCAWIHGSPNFFLLHQFYRNHKLYASCHPFICMQLCVCVCLCPYTSLQCLDRANFKTKVNRGFLCPLSFRLWLLRGGTHLWGKLWV